MDTFNLSKFLKKAFYDGGQGLAVAQTRALQNCEKQKIDKGMSPQEAKTKCREEFQQANEKADWILDYSGAKDEGKKPYLDAKTPAAKEIK